MLASPALADDCFLKAVTLKKYPPGSLIVRYGGVKGRIIDEASKRAGDIWESQIQLENPTYLGYLAAKREMSFAYDDMNAGGQWWKRDWWWSLEEEDGGAPRIPIFVIKGLSHDLIRLGPIYVNNKFKFKLREYDFDITSRRSFYYWHFKIKPKAKLSLKHIIKEARLGLTFTLLHRGLKLLAIELYAGYKVKAGATLGIQFSLLRW